MTFSRWIFRFPAAVAALLSLPDTSAAQGASVSAVSVSTNHSLLEDRLFGAAARLNVPLLGGHLSARLGAERLSGDSRRTGAPCAGLIRPGTCAPEPLRDDARLTSVAGGLALRVLSSQRFALEVAGDLRLGRVRADTRGLTSGGTLTAGKTLWGGDVGVEGSWSPWTHVPLALEVGATAGGLWPVTHVADGYTPFEIGFDVSRLRVGLAWRQRSR